jgi:hypothetical protein
MARAVCSPETTAASLRGACLSRGARVHPGAPYSPHASLRAEYNTAGVPCGHLGQLHMIPVREGSPMAPEPFARPGVS